MCIRDRTYNTLKMPRIGSALMRGREGLLVLSRLRCSGLCGCIVCGCLLYTSTHTLAVALFGLLRAGDTLLAATGRPYDTLEGVIGLDGKLSLIHILPWLFGSSRPLPDHK